MANFSDAFGIVKVNKVGQEFGEFLKVVQHNGAYYTLVNREDIEDIKPDKDLEFDFSTAGRWNYGNNLDGYLNGEWMTNTDEEIKAYAKFITALKKKDGSVIIEYNDSDIAMGWMGTGIAKLSIVRGGLKFTNDFDEQEMTISNYAKMNGEDEYWALEYIYGDEVYDKYRKYSEKCKSHGTEPVEPSNWYGIIYKPEE